MADPALQRMLYRTALSLPEPILRVMAGGGVIYRGGRTLDPKFQFLCKAWSGPRFSPDTDPEDARSDWSEMTRAFAAKPEKGVTTETILLDGPGAVITTRLYRPADQDSGAPMLVFFHAGAGVVGDLDASDGLCTELARIGRTVGAGAGLSACAGEVAFRPDSKTRWRPMSGRRRTRRGMVRPARRSAANPWAAVLRRRSARS